MVAAAAYGSAVPGVDHIEGQRCVRRNVGVQPVAGSPGTEPHAGDGLAGRTGRAEQEADGRCRPRRSDPRSPPRTSTCRRSSEESTLRVVPAPPCSPKTSQGSSACRSSMVTPDRSTVPSTGKAELEVRTEPLCFERQAGLPQVGYHSLEIGPQEVRQHEPVVQRSAPSYQPLPVGLLPEPRDQRAYEQLRARLMRACGAISNARNSTRPEPAHRALGRVELVDADLCAMRVSADIDEEIAKQPVDQPGRNRSARVRKLLKRDLEFIEGFVPRLVRARRLTGRPDELAREHVGQRRMVLPKRDNAGQQVRPSQEGAVGWRHTTGYDVISSARCRGGGHPSGISAPPDPAPQPLRRRPS